VVGAVGVVGVAGAVGVVGVVDDCTADLDGSELPPPQPATAALKAAARIRAASGAVVIFIIKYYCHAAQLN